MDKYYYLIPLFDRYTYLNDIRLDEMMRSSYPDLYNLEEEKARLYKETNNSLDRYYEVDKQVKCLYNSFNLPEYLICVEENGMMHELITNGVIKTRSIAELECHVVPFDIACEYYNYSNYNDKLCRYYSDFILYRNTNKIKELRYNTLELKK